LPWRRVFVIALVAALIWATETEHRQALADGFQPAMMVMAALCAVAVIVTGCPSRRRHGRSPG